LDHKREAQRIFSAASAQRWSDLYEKPANLFEHAVRQRRDVVFRVADECFPAASRVLDVGCGTGVIGEYLLQAGHSVLAMDLTHDMLTLAKQRLERFPPERRLVLNGDCEVLPFAGQSFDAVVCLGVISFLRRDDSALAEIARVLRAHGSFVLAVRNRFALNRFLDPVRVVRKALRPIGSMLRRRSGRGGGRGDEAEVEIPRLYNVPELEKRLRTYGLAVRERIGLGYGPLTLGGRKILPVAADIWLSDAIGRAFGVPILRSTLPLADVWVLVGERVAGPGADLSADAARCRAGSARADQRPSARRSE
jgi:ubiquinone/menaquinone biosynthesis C-methylase UbiE